METGCRTGTRIHKGLQLSKKQSSAVKTSQQVSRSCSSGITEASYLSQPVPVSPRSPPLGPTLDCFYESDYVFRSLIQVGDGDEDGKQMKTKTSGNVGGHICFGQHFLFDSFSC